MYFCVFYLFFLQMPVDSFGMGSIPKARMDIWRLVDNRATILDKVTAKVSHAPSPTLQYLVGGNMRDVAHVDSLIDNYLCKRYALNTASRAAYVGLVRNLIAQEQSLSDTHDIFYHGTSSLSTMLLYRNLLCPESNRPLLLRRPSDECFPMNTKSIVSYIEHEARRMSAGPPVLRGDGLTSYSRLDWDQKIAAMLLSANVSVCGNSMKTGESSFEFIVNPPVILTQMGKKNGNGSYMLGLSAGILSISVLAELLPEFLLVPFVPIVTAAFVTLKNEEQRNDNLNDLLQEFGCCEEKRMHYFDKMIQNQANLAGALVQFAVPKELRNSWYFSYPFGYPICQADRLSDDDIQKKMAM
jgi:hypothetical protein